MDEQLQSFVSNYLYLADTRNISFDNPVTLELQPDHRVFKMVVSFSEPSFSQLPYNVLWICYDESDPWHAKLYRRSDHNQSQTPDHIGKKYTWVELTTYDQIYDEDQYYQDVNTTPAHELGQSWVNVGAANEEIAGLVLVNKDAADGEPVAVSDNDPRMSDAREPLPHNHPDIPRTMVHVKGFYTPDSKYPDLVNDDEYFVSFDAAQVPAVNEMFFITGQNPSRPNEWYGEWRIPTQDDIWVDNAHIVSVNVRIASGELPGNISDGTTITLGADSVYDDASTIVDDSTVVWVIAPNAAGVTIHPTTGELVIPDITGDTVVSIQATCTDKYWPETALGTIELTIRDLFTEKVLMSLDILGPNSIDEQTSGTYQVEATYNDNSTEIVTADSFIANNPTAATLVGEELTGKDIVSDEIVTLSATFTHAGITLNTDKPVTIIATIIPVSLEILGPVSMNELTTIELQAQVTYSDGSMNVVLIADSTWALDAPYANIDIVPASDKVAYTGNLDISGNESFQVNVDATVDGQALAANKVITVIDTTVPKIPQSLEIVGNANINEQTASNVYTFLVTYTDLTTAIVYANAGTFLSDNSVLSTATDDQVDGSSKVIQGNIAAITDITADQTINLSAAYTENGTTVNGALVVTIVADPPTAVSLAISGPTEMNENSNAELTATVTFDDASTEVISGSASTYPAIWSYLETAVGVTDIQLTTTQRFLSGTDLAADDSFEVQCTVNVGGVPLTATHTVLVKDIPLIPNSLTIMGTTTINENDTATYTFQVGYSDGSNSMVGSVDIATVDNDFVAGITTSGAFTSGEVSGDTPIQISAQVLINGVTVSDTHNVTIIDIPVPVSLAILGQDSVAEQGSFNYTFEVTYSDGSKVTVPTVDNSTVEVAAGTFSGSGSFDTSAIDNDFSATLDASVTIDGVLMNATKAVTVLANAIPVSMVIEGDATMNENTSGTYQFRVTFNDGSDALVTPATFTSDNAALTVTNVSGSVDANEVATDTALQLGASYTLEGATVNAVLSVSVIDIPVPTGIEIIGATTINEGATEAYTFEVTMSDGSTKPVTATTSGATVGTFNTAGSFNAPSVTDVTVSTLSCGYTENGVTVNDTHDVTIANSANLPVSLVITGAPTINEGTLNEQLTATVTYEDGATANVTASSTWSKVSGAGAAINAGSGVVTSVANITDDTNIRFKAEFTANGVTVSDNHDMIVLNSANLLTSLKVTGANVTQEGGSNLTLVATATYEDTTTSIVTIPATWTIVSGGAAGSVNGSGVFTPASNVGSDTVVTVRASYLDNGITKTDDHNITVTDVAVPASIVITGGTTMDEGTAGINLTAIVTYSDGSNINETTDSGTTWSIQSGPGTINQSGRFVPPADVASDAVVVVHVTHTKLGATVTDTHNITVTDIVASGYAARWGVVPEVNALADYNEAFMDSLANPLAGTDGEVFRPSASSVNYVYMAWPDTLGFAQIQEEGTGTPGGYDGATDLNTENTFSYNDGAGDSVANGDGVWLYDGSTNVGALRVVIGGQGYIIYRKVTTRNTDFNVTLIKFGTPNRKSQFDT